MIYCPNCGTSNQKGSRFCNECGEPLPSTGIRCPMCDTTNAVGNVYCQACNARLVPMSAPPEGEPEEEASHPIKGVSLPSIPLEGEEGDTEEAPQEAPPEEAPSTPGWLAELRESTEDVPEEPERTEVDSSKPFTGTDIPDWLSSMGPVGEESGPAPKSGTPAPVDAGESSERAAVPPPEPGDIPDWIRDLGPVAEAEPALGEDEPPLEEPRPEQPADEDLAHGEPATAEADLDEAPDWLRDILTSSTEIDQEPQPESEPESEDSSEPEDAVEDESLIEIPEWLKQGSTGVPPQPPQTEPQLEQPPEGRSAHEEPPPEEETSDISLEAIAIPSWLEEAQTRTHAPPSGEPPPPFTETPPEDVDTPDWLTDLMAATSVEEEEEEDVPPFAEDELESAEPQAEANLERADIPSWLQELRPGRPGAGRAAAGPPETKGLLKGLRGVLPSAESMRAPGTLEGIHIREPDQASLARAELLQSLLGQPALRPRQRSRKTTTGPSNIGDRIFVAAILIAAVAGMLLAPLVVGQGPHLTQPLATAGAARLHDLVEGLDSQDSVLIAFDYGPPEADELNAAALPVLKHLLERGVNLLVVTTRPDGSVMAEDVLADVASNEQYRLIGYRPGAAMAASQLLDTTDDTPSLLLALSGQPLPLLLWIEQASAAHGDHLPVAAVGSAALEPVASPYLDAAAGQLSGAIFGYQGGSSYESIQGIAGDATARLDALAAGHLAIILTMIGGAFLHALKGRGEEAA